KPDKGLIAHRRLIVSEVDADLRGRAQGTLGNRSVEVRKVGSVLFVGKVDRRRVLEVTPQKEGIRSEPRRDIIGVKVNESQWSVKIPTGGDPVVALAGARHVRGWAIL